MGSIRSARLLRVGLLAGLALATGGCGGTRPPAAGRGLVLVVSGDTGGWIAPCGCTANQSGGLPRRGTFLHDEQKARDVVYADAGGAPGGTSHYDRVKFESILDGEREMGLVAHNLGGPEAALGASYLRGLEKKGVPFVSANLRDARGGSIAPASVVATVGGRRVAVVGVVSPRYAVAGLEVDDPRDAILKAIPPHDVLIVLAYLPEAELRALAAALPEADLVVGGPTGQAIAPARVGPTWLASATNKGKFLVRMESDGPGAPWTGRVVEMGPEIADDHAQANKVADFRSLLAGLDIPADETGLAAPLPKGMPETYRVAGSASCLSCHVKDAASWVHSRHAHAWESLRAREGQADPQCQRCHSTGYGLPGGFRSAHRSEDRTSVGCESCHGPSRGHALRPANRTQFAARDQCLSCHDAENSPRFDLDRFWDQIRHGKPSDPAAGPGTEARP